MKKLSGLFLSALIALAPINVGMATLVSLPSPFYYPGLVGSPTSAPAFGVQATLDAAGEYTSFIFVAREDMTVSHVSFRAGAVSTSGVVTAEVRIETVDSSGLPSGTLWSTNTNATTAAITSNSNVTTALTASASITKGQIVCVKVIYAAATSIQVMNLGSVSVPTNATLPYFVINTGTPTKTILNGTSGSFGLGSSSTTFYSVPGTIPVSAITAGPFNNTSSAKRGLLFTPPMNARLVGIRWYNSNATGDYDVCVRTGDAAGTEIGSSCTSFLGAYGVGVNNAAMTVYFDNAVTLTAGTLYRITIEPTSATNVNVTTWTIVANQFGGTPAGTTGVYTSAVSGTWTDSTTQQPMMDAILDQIDDGAGGGGGGVPRCIGCQIAVGC